jgi:hypothetical protein
MFTKAASDEDEKEKEVILLHWEIITYIIYSMAGSSYTVTLIPVRFKTRFRVTKDDDKMQVQGSSKIIIIVNYVVLVGDDDDDEEEELQGETVD